MVCNVYNFSYMVYIIALQQLKIFSGTIKALIAITNIITSQILAYRSTGMHVICQIYDK